MAYPYVPSAGPLLKTLEHFRRKRVPDEINAEVLKKLGLAPKNESYVLNVLRFLGVIDAGDRADEEKSKIFVQHKEEAFASAFEELVQDAYQELFRLHGSEAWSLERQELVHFFRTSDSSSDVVGKRQAGTFIALAGLAGHGDVPQIRQRVDSPERAGRLGKKKAESKDTSKKGSALEKPEDADDGTLPSRFGLTVRVEVNLPAEGNQETYDRIFRSIRKNLIDG